MKAIGGFAEIQRKPRTRPALKPFREILPTDHLWPLCRDYQDCIPVTYGTINGFMRALTRDLTEAEKTWAIQRRLIHRYPDGRAFKIMLRIKQGYVIGGQVWLKDSKGRSITIHDEKSLFQQNWRTVQRIYGESNLAVIMSRVRDSLREVGNISADQGAWERCSSITSSLWRRMDIDLSQIPKIIHLRPNEPGNLQGYSVFGHTYEPVYFYDLRSAYLAEMAQSPVLNGFAREIWRIRQELEAANDPTAYLLKLAGTIIPGKFTSELPDNRFYRPDLGRYIRQRVNDKLRQAMDLAGPGNVYRWCVDGFIASSNVGHTLDIGANLGQWKPVEQHSGLVIAKTNIWWADAIHKDGGFRVSKTQVLADPEEIHTSRLTYDWDALEEREEPVTLYQNHYEPRCRGCINGTDLHDALPAYVIPFRAEDYL